MIKQLEKLTPEEKALLLKAPVLVSILAASGDHEIDKKEKAEATKLIHLKTFTADPLLIPYYKEVEKRFNAYFNETIKKYAPFDNIRLQALKIEIRVLDDIIKKLDKDFARVLHKSLAGYAEHVRKADASFMEDFMFPIPIHGLTD